MPRDGPRNGKGLKLGENGGARVTFLAGDGPILMRISGVKGEVRWDVVHLERWS